MVGVCQYDGAAQVRTNNTSTGDNKSRIVASNAPSFTQFFLMGCFRVGHGGNQGRPASLRNDKPRFIWTRFSRRATDAP
jgi:hypothetical protein